MYKINTIKNDYFSEENIQNFPERLVIIGFIAADGCIRDKLKGQNMLVFNISNKDVEILNFINKEIANSKRHISLLKNTNSNMLTFPSNEICNDLKRYNIIPRKTNNYRLPILSNIEMSYFLKGYFYGDGSLVKKSNQDNIYLVGNELFAKDLKNYLETNNIIDNCKLYNIGKNNYKQIHITGLDANKLSKFIFRDDKFILLPRKTQIINNKIFNSKWSKDETNLLIKMGLNNINEFCNITGRTLKSSKHRYKILEKNNWIMPYRGKN